MKEFEMQKWEYQTVTINRKIKLTGSLTEWEPKIDLAKFGELGWELVSTTPIADVQGSAVTTQVVYYFKRPME
jgi:hypothetical protein